MSLELANEDLVVIATPNGAWVPNGDTTLQTNLKCKSLGKKQAITSITWTPSGCVLPSYTFIAGSGSITPTAIKCSCNGQTPHRKGDTGSCTGSFQLTANPFTPLVCTCNLSISDAGQIKAKGV
jgi:hypothetical protein